VEAAVTFNLVVSWTCARVALIELPARPPITTPIRIHPARFTMFMMLPLLVSGARRLTRNHLYMALCRTPQEVADIIESVSTAA
jgi:hypothetical protein